MTEKMWPMDFREKWRVHVTGWDGPRGRSLFVSAQAPGGERLAAVSLQWEEVPRGSPYKPILEETFEENRDNVGDVQNFLQAVVDAAWDAGIKPTQAKAGDGEIGAVRAHLEDMRTLVFRTPGEVPPLTARMREP